MGRVLVLEKAGKEDPLEEERLPLPRWPALGLWVQPSVLEEASGRSPQKGTPWQAGMGRHSEAEAGARADSLRPTVSVFCSLLVQLQWAGGNREGPEHFCKKRASGIFAEHVPF